MKLGAWLGDDLAQTHMLNYRKYFAFCRKLAGTLAGAEGVETLIEI
jgi:hypothetical protein